MDESFAKDEKKAYQKRGPTPTQLHHDAMGIHITYVETQCSKQDAELATLRERFGALSSEHSRLGEAYHGLVFNNGIRSVRVAIGGVMVSIACSANYTYQHYIGMSLFGAGIAIQTFQLIRAKCLGSP